MSPAPFLAAIIGVFHVSAYVFIRGRVGARLPFLVVAAILGAWAGDTVGTRVAIDPVRIGEFNVLLSSFVAWLGIGLVAILSILIPEEAAPREPAVSTHVRPRSPDASRPEPDRGATQPPAAD